MIEFSGESPFVSASDKGRVIAKWASPGLRFGHRNFYPPVLSTNQTF
jgi:hypothetical protein